MSWPSDHACDRPARRARAAMRGGLAQPNVHGRRVAAKRLRVDGWCIVAEWPYVDGRHVAIKRSYVEGGRISPVCCCYGRRVRRRHRIGWSETGREMEMDEKRRGGTSDGRRELGRSGKRWAG